MAHRTQRATSLAIAVGVNDLRLVSILNDGPEMSTSSNVDIRDRRRDALAIALAIENDNQVPCI